MLGKPRGNIINSICPAIVLAFGIQRFEVKDSNTILVVIQVMIQILKLIRVQMHYLHLLINSSLQNHILEELK